MIEIKLTSTELSDILVALKHGYHNNNGEYGKRCAILHDKLLGQQELT